MLKSIVEQVSKLRTRPDVSRKFPNPIVGAFQEEAKALGLINHIGVSDINDTEQRISKVHCNRHTERDTLQEPVIETTIPHDSQATQYHLKKKSISHIKWQPCASPMIDDFKQCACKAHSQIRATLQHH